MTFYSDARIITVDGIEDIEAEFAKADNETLVIFDYYGVLSESADTADENPPGKSATRDKWPALIEMLQSRGIKTALLTSCGAEKQGPFEAAEGVLRDRLLNVGIDFRKSWTGLAGLKLPSARQVGGFGCPSFAEGMLLAAGADKGEVLKAFLSRVPQYKFGKIIFIDDRLKNLVSVEKICPEINAGFIGIEYRPSKTGVRRPSAAATKETGVVP
jgi:hypothetical protein